MDTGMIFEIIGYVASALVAISLMMSSLLKLRVINLVGAIFFTVYGLLIKAYPVAAVNFLIVLIDLYYLYEMFNTLEYFKLLHVQNNSDYMRYFLRFYEKDIQHFLPGFSYTYDPNHVIFFVLRNMVPAGLFIGEKRDENTLYVLLDFVIPGYRDFKIADFVYRIRADFFEDQGINQIVTPSGNKIHAAYLRRMGFSPDPQQPELFRYQIQ